MISFIEEVNRYRPTMMTVLVPLSHNNLKLTIRKRKVRQGQGRRKVFSVEYICWKVKVPKGVLQMFNNAYTFTCITRYFYVLIPKSLSITKKIKFLEYYKTVCVHVCV